jgi:ABC-2 type transport system ATP-binding protein
MSAPSSGERDAVIRVENLHKTFAFGFFRRKVHAVRGVGFEVKRGEIFGFLGPNGAGKTTTIKMLMGLIFPSSGKMELLGRRVPDVAAKRKLGFLPESPYFYDYLTGAELIDFAGRLFDLGAGERRARGEKLLALVGLEQAAAMPLRKYSKGMLQRLGLAQALVNDPELVVLDEPMSGLDPIGRKEIRDLIASLRAEGRTVFFSTHILSDVEMLCDRCAILVAGKLRDVGPLDQLLSPKLLHTEIVVERAGAKEEKRLPPGEDVDAFLRAAIDGGAKIVSVNPRRERLEDLFVREVEADRRGAQAGGAAAAPRGSGLASAAKEPQ